MSTPSTRLLAIGGVLGPLIFVATWAVAGSVTEGYSAADDAISDLAATGASTRTAMTLGFVAFGIGVIAFGLALRAVGADPAWISAVATAGFTLAVAATPLGAPARDTVHGAFASLGYITLVGVPLLAAKPLADAGRVGWARYSGASAIVSAAFLLASAIGPVHGFLQRAGLTVGDVWIVAVVCTLVSGRSLFLPVGATRRSR